MKSQLQNLFFWVGVGLIIVLVTVFYQPAAAKTGSLLVWTNNRVYVMDIDSLNLTRVGPAPAGTVLAASPGCMGQTETPCWVAAGQNIYRVEGEGAEASPPQVLPVGEGFTWPDGAVSWSPDGVHLAYSVFNQAENRAELHLFNAATGQTQTVAQGIDPEIKPAWTAGCATGPVAADCALAYKTRPLNVGETEVLPSLVAVKPGSGEERSWELSTEPIFELRWTRDDQLLYSRPARHFRYAEDNTPAYIAPTASKLANLSPDGYYTVYYQPFTLAGCQTELGEDCLHLGVWLTHRGEGGDEPRLIYNVDLAHANNAGLNFVPVWSPQHNSFVFFQEGKLIYYDLESQEATVWYRPVGGKLRSEPVFSPNEEAVAFVDNQGQGFSEYRLVIVNPRLQPIEHIVDTDSGIRILAWLPN